MVPIDDGQDIHVGQPLMPEPSRPLHPTQHTHELTLPPVETGIRSSVMAKIKTDLTFPEIVGKVKDFIEDALDEALPEREVVDTALDKVVEWVDERVSYGLSPVGLIIDSVDHLVLRMVLRLLVDAVYKGLDLDEDLEKE